jgi:DeoR/GlpR family transcriptional regulator of sugar metabolism
VDRKACLAAAAVSIVRSKQIILLDAGSTNVAIADALPDNADLTVVTNSPEAAARLLNRPGFEVILVGGRIARGAAGSLGATALLQIQQIRAAFDAEDAELKRAMLKASGQIAIAMTSEKLMTAAPFSVAPASAVDYLFVEADVSAARLASLEAVCDNVMVARS